MRRRGRIGPWALATLLLAALLWGGWQWMRRGEAEALQLAQQQRALYELTAQVEQAQVLLAKSAVAASDGQRVLYLTDAWRQAFGAQSNINQLPLGSEALMRTSQLLAQAGDFAYAVARAAAAGEPTTEEQRRVLAELQHQLGLVSERLHDIIGRASRGGRLSWRELRNLTNARLADGPNGLRDGFDELGKQLVEFPTLIYDGPFSDHVVERSPRGLAGGAVDKAGAEHIARRFVGLDPGDGGVRVRGEAEGAVAAWQIEMERPGRVVHMDISRQGGHVVWMLDDRAVGPARLTEEEGLEAARRFLAERGYEDVTPTWMGRTENRLVIPFVAVDGDVVVYPDMIKVTVALDDGGVVGFDALGWLMAHRERDIPAPAVDEEEARARVHGSLRPQRGRLALIPRETLEEVLTWEFPAATEGGQYVVYVNALTGEEERILKLLDTDEGWLVL